MVKKRKTKAKTKTRRAPKRTPKRVAAAKPTSKAHEMTLKVVNRALQASENAAAKVIAAEEKLEASMAKVEKAVKTASRKKSALAARALMASRNAAAKARAGLTAAKGKARELEKNLKEAVKSAEIIRLKDEAKNKAVTTFLDKWERAYERKFAKKARAGKKRRTRKKTATA